MEGAVVVNETVNVIHCGLEVRDGWQIVWAGVPAGSRERLMVFGIGLGLGICEVSCMLSSTPVTFSRCLSPVLGPGIGGCLWKVMEIRWNVGYVECGMEIGNCYNYCHINGKVFKNICCSLWRENVRMTFN